MERKNAIGDNAPVTARLVYAMQSRHACLVTSRNVETRVRRPSLTTLLQLAMATECNVTDLVGVFDKTDPRQLLAK